MLAVVIWIVASAAFAVYVANFASYNKTYGTLGGVIVFLIWLWISNIAVLLGRSSTPSWSAAASWKPDCRPSGSFSSSHAIEPKPSPAG